MHIGRGKTGTTALQRLFASARAGLQQQGVRYVVAGNSPGGYGHNNFAKAFIDAPAPYMVMPRNLDEVVEAVRSELLAAGEPRIVMSAENFASADPRRVASFVEAAVPGAEVRIIFFARSQDELVESQCNQFVRTARIQVSFESFIASYDEELEFDRVLEPWATVFGKGAIIARVYDGAAPIAEMVTWLPLRVPLELDPQVASGVNASSGIIATELMRLLNGHEIDVRHRAYAALARALEPLDLPPVYFSADEARTYRRRFAASNRNFSRTYLGRDLADLGGRRYSDEARDSVRAMAEMLPVGGAQRSPASSSSLTIG